MGHHDQDRDARALRRRSERRTATVALLASVGIHIVVAQLHWRMKSPVPGVGGPIPATVRSALEVVNLTTVDERPAALGEAVVAVEPDPVPRSTDEAAAAAPAVVSIVGPTSAPRPTTPSAASRLRGSGTDPRLFGSAGETLPDEAAAQAIVSSAVADLLAAPPVISGRDSLKFAVWGDDAEGLGLRPGVLTIGGVALPFCGGPDAARCGFGARPWDLEKADRAVEFLRGLEGQDRWEAVQERARQMRSRADARRDTTSGG